MAEEDAAASTGVVGVAMANNNNRTKDHLRNSVVDFLLHENYLLTAFELLHELQEDGLVEVEAATKLQLFFANSQMFPPDELAKMQALHGTLLSFKKNFISDLSSTFSSICIFLPLTLSSSYIVFLFLRWATTHRTFFSIS
jgi:hypothetical protein